MRFHVNENCIACEMCVGVCPEVFAMADDGLAKAVDHEVEGETAATATEAMEGCPVDAIEEA